METPILKAETRTELGKGPSRRLRVAGRVPAVVYGHGIDPLHLHVSRQEITALVRRDGVNAVLDLEVDGEKHLTMVKHIEQDILSLEIAHMDFQYIKRGEKVEVEVPLIIEGSSVAGTEVLQVADVLMVKADVLSIPEHIFVNVEGLEDGAVVTAVDLTIPEGSELIAEDDTVILTVSVPQVDEELEAAAEAAEEGGAEAGAEASEPEEGAESEE